MSSSSSQQQEDAHHPFCSLPGDPSLLLTTNVDLGDQKLEIMKGTYQKGLSLFYRDIHLLFPCSLISPWDCLHFH